MSLKYILLVTALSVFSFGCTNDLKFSKGSNTGLDIPPGVCPNAISDFTPPPSLVEVGQNLDLQVSGGEAFWYIQLPNGSQIQLQGNDVDFVVGQTGRHMGKLESVDACGTVQVLNFVFEAFLPVGQSSVVINSGEQYTSRAQVTLDLASEGATEMYITQDASCSSGGQWEVYDTRKLYTLAQLNQNSHVYVMFKNPVGNTSACVSDSIIHDDIKPNVSIVSAPAAITNQINANFSLDANDSGSGVDIYFCSLDSNNVNICSDQVSYTKLADGSHSFSVRVSDKAGNLSDWAQYSWAIDSVKPSVQFTKTPSNPSNSSPADFEFVGSDVGMGIDSYECKLDSGAFTACSSPSSINVTDGSHVYYVRAKDKAGNLSDEISYAWDVDANGPVIQLLASPANPTSSKDANFQFSVSDSGLGLDSVDCSLDGASAQPCVDLANYSNLALGSHSFIISASDKAGNTSSLTYNWDIIENIIDQPEVVPPGAGTADILFVMDNTASMYTEYREQIGKQMRNFLSGLNSDFQIGVITGDDRQNSSPYSGGNIVPIENISPSEYVMTPATKDLDDNFIETLARKEVTCAHGTWTGPNGRFCGPSGWNLPSSSQLISATLLALEKPENQILFRDEATLNIVIVSDSNEVCSSGMYGNDGMCLPQDTEHRAETVVDLVQSKWPAKSLKVHSLIWRNEDNCAFKDGSKKGTTYEYLSQITGGVSRSICKVAPSEGNAIAEAITKSVDYSIELQCNPLDYNNDGVVDANDVIVTYEPQPSELPTTHLIGNKLKFSPAPEVGTKLNLKYKCP